jgi:hypothetical protein
VFQLKKLLKKDDGNVLILVTAALIVLIGFAALAVDIGYFYSERAKLVTAADAAALAGAQLLPDAGEAGDQAIHIAQENGVMASQTTITTPYNGDPYKIEVVCTRNNPYMFAKVLGLESANITARAVAKKNRWNGEALPFINLTFDYSIEDPTAWTKVGPGIKGTITDFYTRNSDTGDLYFEIDYMDGITVTPGYANGTKGLDGSKLKDGIAEVLKKSDENVKVVYLFSLSSKVIQKGEFTVNNKSNTVSLDKLNKLKNGDVIDPDQLVLIECLFLGCDYNNHHNIQLQFLGNVYDLGNNDPDNPLPDFPTEQLNSRSTRLIE